MYAYNYNLLPADWNDFKKLILKNKDFKADTEKNNYGSFEHVFEKINKVGIAKYDIDDMKVYTSISKRDFFDICRAKSKMPTEDIMSLALTER